MFKLHRGRILHVALDQYMLFIVQMTPNKVYSILLHSILHEINLFWVELIGKWGRTSSIIDVGIKS